MQYLRCLQKGHPQPHFTKTITNTKSDKEIDDKKSKSSKLSKPTKNIKAESIKNICNSHI